MDGMQGYVFRCLLVCEQDTRQQAMGREAERRGRLGQALRDHNVGGFVPRRSNDDDVLWSFGSFLHFFKWP